MKEQKNNPIKKESRPAPAGDRASQPKSGAPAAEKSQPVAFSQTVRGKIGGFFEKHDIRDEKVFKKVFKTLIFVLVLFVQALIVLQFVDVDIKKSAGVWILFFCAVGGLTVFECVTLFLVKKARYRLVCYLLDFLCIIVLCSIAGNTYLSILYMIIATEMYFSTEKALPSVSVFIGCLIAYLLTYSAVAFFSLGVGLTTMQVIRQSFGALGALTIHFFIVKSVIVFYRQYLRLTQALKELDASNRALEKAYSELAEATVLAERQRIAKDIHDTAGHSITTVIMQTEAAKLIIDKNPEEAKAKIVAANLQAKHTLEELRESVHLLSGVAEKEPLKSALMRIISESTDGTGIKIRSDIDSVNVSDEVFRFITNALKEGISNGLRHGKATAFWLEVKEEEGQLRFLLSDNGNGMDAATLQRGFGLNAMTTEANRLGGYARFVSEQDEGFEIHLALPIEKAKKEQ